MRKRTYRINRIKLFAMLALLLVLLLMLILLVRAVLKPEDEPGAVTLISTGRKRPTTSVSTTIGRTSSLR